MGNVQEEEIKNYLQIWHKTSKNQQLNNHHFRKNAL